MDGITQPPHVGSGPQKNAPPTQPHQSSDGDNFYSADNVDDFGPEPYYQESFEKHEDMQSAAPHSDAPYANPYGIPEPYYQPLSPRSYHPPQKAPSIISEHTPHFDESVQPFEPPRQSYVPPKISSVPVQASAQASDNIFPVSPQIKIEPDQRSYNDPAPAIDVASFGSVQQPTPIPAASPIPAAPESLPARQGDEKVSYQDAKIQELDITKISANPFQPRKLFKPEALQELSDSIREHGVVQPIVVTESPTGYEIVVGERRFRASQLAGLTSIPAIVKKTLHDQTKLEVALIENIQRQELNAIEEAQAYDRLIKTFKMTQDQVAKKVGKSRPAITNTLRLLNLPAEIQRGVIEGRISEGHARAILGLPDVERQLLMYQAIQDQGLNVRQVESKVREISVKRKLDAATPDPKLLAIESELRGKLGAQVKIQRQGRGGKITIEFFSDEDLEEIMNRMAENKENDDNNYFTV